MLQLERNLCFLCVKEGHADAPLACIGGALFIGKFPAKMRTRLALTLQQYAAALPLLTALQAQGQFLCIDVHMHQRSMVDSLRTEREMQRLEMRLERQREESNARVAALEAMVAALLKNK